MILVTGGTGFLGAYLLHYLIRQGRNVRATFRPYSDFSLVEDIRGQIEWVPCNLLDVNALADAMTGVEEIYHAAAKVSFRKKDAERMIHINEQSTANVVNLALEKGVKKLLHVSSIAALGRRLAHEEIDETVRWEWSSQNTAYAISKFRAEQEVWRGMAEGLNAVIINPSLILGAGRWNSGTASMFRSVARGLPAVPAGVNGMVDVRDVARIAIRLMDSDIHTERFILNSENLSYRNLFNMIAEATGAKAPSFEMKAWHGRIVARTEAILAFLQRRHARLDMDYVKSFGKNFYYSNEKIKEALDVEFIPIAQNVKDTARVYLERKRPALLPLF